MEKYGKYGQRRFIFSIVVIGLLFFIFIYFPFFATNLRYLVGSSFTIVFDAIGSGFMLIGVLFLGLAIFEILTRGHNWLGKLVIGLVFVYIGCWLTGTFIEFMGFTFGDSNSHGGYH